MVLSIIPLFVEYSITSRVSVEFRTGRNILSERPAVQLVTSNAAHLLSAASWLLRSLLLRHITRALEVYGGGLTLFAF